MEYVLRKYRKKRSRAAEQNREQVECDCSENDLRLRTYLIPAASDSNVIFSFGRTGRFTMSALPACPLACIPRISSSVQRYTTVRSELMTYVPVAAFWIAITIPPMPGPTTAAT